MTIIKYLIIVILLIVSKNSFATEGDNKFISGKIKTEFFFVDNYTSNNKKNIYKDYYNRTKLSLRANITDQLSLNSVIKSSKMKQNLENEMRDKSLTGSGTRSFENHGAYLEKLYLKYSTNNLDLFAGKKTLNFGNAWKKSQYMWILNKSLEYYQFNEKFALGGVLKGGREDGNGKYLLTLGSYFNDDKYSDNSRITKREYIGNNTTKSGDDKSLFASYYAALDISYDFGNDEKLTYHFGYVKSAIADRGYDVERLEVSDQKSYVANINYQIPVTKNILPKIFIEYVFLDNYGGSNLKNSHLLTKYITLNLYQNYHLTYTIFKVKHFEIGTNNIDKDIDEISLGYKFNKNNILNGLSTRIGYNREVINKKTSNEETESAILYLKYEYKF